MMRAAVFEHRDEISGWYRLLKLRAQGSAGNACCRNQQNRQPLHFTLLARSLITEPSQAKRAARFPVQRALYANVSSD